MNTLINNINNGKHVLIKVDTNDTNKRQIVNAYVYLYRRYSNLITVCDNIVNDTLHNTFIGVSFKVTKFKRIVFVSRTNTSLINKILTKGHNRIVYDINQLTGIPDVYGTIDMLVSYQDKYFNKVLSLKSGNILIFDTETNGLPYVNPRTGKRTVMSIINNQHDYDNQALNYTCNCICCASPRYNTQSGAYNKIHMLSIGYLIVDHNYNILTRNCIYIHQHNVINFKPALEVHGITDDILKSKGVSVRDMYKQLLQDFNKYHCDYILGHNVDFDYNMLLLELTRNGIDYKDLVNDTTICDTKSLVNRTTFFTPLSTLVSDHLQVLDEDNNELNPHNALYDCYLTLKYLQTRLL